MNKHLSGILGCVLVLLSPSCAWAGKLNVTLSPSHQVVKQGDAPKFLVKATAATASLRIMRFDRRHDLLDNYCTIRVTRNGKEVDVAAVHDHAGAP